MPVARADRLLVSAAIALGRAGMLMVGSGWMRVFRVGIWLLVIQLALNTLANVASSSPYERFGMSVVTLVLWVCCLGLARSPVPTAATASSRN